LLTQLRKSAIDMEEILYDSSSRYASYPVFVLNYCLKNPVLFDRKGNRIEVPGGGSLREFFEAEGLWDQDLYENEIPKYQTMPSGSGDDPGGKFGHDRADEQFIESVDFSSQESLGKCPECAGRVFEHGDAYVCEKSVGPERTCKFRTDKILLQQPIDTTQIKKLLAEGKTDLLDGFVSSRGKMFSACLVVSEGQVIFDFQKINTDPVDFSSQESLGKCPRCAARVFEQSDAYVCENSVDPEKTCDFRSGKIILQQPIDTTQIKKLLADGKTDLLDDFVSNRTCQKFSAFLVIKEGKLGFEFDTQPAQEKASASSKKTVKSKATNASTARKKKSI